MNIPASLLDLMNSVSPGNIKWLTKSEAELYFPSEDPVWEDQKLSRFATEQNISKEAYIKRQQRTYRECIQPVIDNPEANYGPGAFKCIDDILHGLR